MDDGSDSIWKKFLDSRNRERYLSRVMRVPTDLSIGHDTTKTDSEESKGCHPRPSDKNKQSEKNLYMWKEFGIWNEIVAHSVEQCPQVGTRKV